MPRQPRPTPARMLNAVLDLLELSAEWNTKTLKDLEWILTEGNYAVRKNGVFKAKRCADIETPEDMYAKGWEAGRKAALIEIAEGVRA